MFNQTHVCEAKQEAANSLSERTRVSASNMQINFVEKPRPAWKLVVRFLSQAAFGGALGGYALVIGIALLNYRGPYNFMLIIALPFMLVGGAALGLLTGAFTLFFENLIEEKLSALARVI